MHKINAKYDKNVGMTNDRSKDGRRRGRKRRNMNQRRKRTYQVEHYTTKTTCTTQCKYKHTWQKMIIFLARKKWFLHEHRNFGQIREQALARKNTMAVWNGLMCEGIKRHTVKEFRKSTLETKVVPFSRNGVKTPHSTSRKYFFIKISSGENVKAKIIACCEKMARKSPKMLSKYKKTCKNGKNREKNTGKITTFWSWLSHAPFIPPLNPTRSSPPSSFSHPQPPSHATRYASPLHQPVGVVSSPPSRLPDWRRCQRPDCARRCRPSLPHLRGLDAPWAPRPTRGAPRQHEGRPATTQATREMRLTWQGRKK